MARYINAGESKVSREDTFFIDPTEIVVDFKGNGRWNPLDHSKVVEHAKSFLIDGQLQPCLARPLHDKRVQLSAGFHRYSAAMLVRNGSPEDGIDADPGFKLMVRVVPMNEKEAFRANVIENKKRNETSAIDDAYNYRRLKMHGYDDAEVCNLFECKESRLRTLESLLLLPTDIQLAVHERRITVTAAVAMAEMPEADRRECLAGAVVATERPVVDGNRIQGAIDAFALTPGVAVDPKAMNKAIKAKRVAAGKKVGLTMSELRAFFKSIAIDDDMPEPAKEVCAAFADFISGKRQGEWMRAQLEKYALQEA